MAKYVINVDLADVWAEKDSRTPLRTLAWGDEVSVVKMGRDYAEIETVEFVESQDGS
ncbi:hypothetical protein ACVWYQ_006569 [Bradyrhizobium sp. USDA 3397]